MHLPKSAMQIPFTYGPSLPPQVEAAPLTCSPTRPGPSWLTIGHELPLGRFDLEVDLLQLPPQAGNALDQLLAALLLRLQVAALALERKPEVAI